MQAKAAYSLFAALLITASVAGAQEAPDTSAAMSSNEMSSVSSGGRFRWGINAVAGIERVTFEGVDGSVSGPMFGADLRLGWQLNDMFAVYLQPHLSFGSLSSDVAGASVSGGTGTFVGTVIGEATFAERFFAGGGVGYGVLNNPSGLTVEARGGFYPFVSNGENGRRKGWMVGLDIRDVFASQNGFSANGLIVMAAIGYEAF